MSERERVVTAIRRLRLDWESLAGDYSLTELEGNVGLFLADFVRYLELDPAEQLAALGERLVIDLSELEVL
jgi:hypothetical protein